MNIRALLVDDEQLARALLREQLGAHPDVEVVAECANGFEAVKAVAEHRPDLVFLDIQMPKLDGFEALELFDPAPCVIFVTAYDEHALRAFEVHAVDYLLKPFAPERLAEALAQARARIARHETATAALAPAAARALAASARPGGAPIERVIVKADARVVVIPIRKVDFFEAQDDYVAVCSEGRKHLKQQTLGEIEAQLDPRRFVRIHRSYLLNVERLARIELYAKDSRIAILADGSKLPLSRAGYARLKELL